LKFREKSVFRSCDFFLNKKIIFAQKLSGTVTSTSMENSVSVSVKRLVEHPIYKKRSVRSKTYIAHLEVTTVKLGDIVNSTMSTFIKT